MNRKIALISTFIFIAVSAWPQMGAQLGPEVKKLEYFLGNWTTEGTVAAGLWGTGGKFSSNDSVEWMSGGFFVQGHSDLKMPAELGGDGKQISFMGYDTQQNVYTYDAFNSQGQRESSKGTVSGDTWTWTSSQNYDGQDVQQKMTVKVLSPTSYSMKFEVSMDGKNWMTFMDGKATKK